MVKIKSDRADIIARAKADAEARKKYKEGLLKKSAVKSFKKSDDKILKDETKELSGNGVKG